MTNQKQMEPLPLSRTEAIRRAVLALGYRAPVPEILDYVRQHFGIGGEPDQPTGDQPAPADTPAAEEAPSGRPARRGKAKDRPAQPE